MAEQSDTPLDEAVLAEMERLADLLELMAAPNQGLRYEGYSGGERRFHERTGEMYFTDPRASQLTLYGGRADKVTDLTESGKRLSAALKSLIALARKSLDGEK